MVTQKERMLAGELYRADDPELGAAYSRAQTLLAAFNATRGDDVERLTRILGDLLGHLGEGAMIKPALHCDYGANISIGARSFVNVGCVLLDCNRIVIGEEVQIAPGVHIYTATHPLDAATRRAGWEAAHPVFIGDGVWLGGGSIVCPGVTIGENTVVGAGSVVTKSLPANVLAVGNPCRVLRALDGTDPEGGGSR
ncbi:maltose O-acetyltransferase [Aureimonas endophytica]|uniref:Nodulation protein L n=1 Tax=Aureimonas endophytica TaxID=2027858 RepID=A0A917E3G1_9HYPH|nr:sugar O-acetyltransferase [Aureimonas endophytica]GGD99368.1 maltose O-acetyltransferase [Aureimonas endophytica]